MRLTAPLLTLLLCACTTLSPRQDDVSLPDVDIPYTRYVLDNGLRLIVHEDHKVPIVAVNIWYHVGSKNEQPGRTGFAHLFEHLMFNGSENYNNEFFEPLEEVGATNMNGTTNTDRTNYFANVPTPALDLLLWMESDRMGHLLGVVDQARLDEQRGVVKNEKRQGENRPYGKAWPEIPKHSYPAGHPYSWSTIGSMQDLDAATLDDVREWFQTWYGAANAVIVIAGDITPAEALEKVEHYFGDIPPGPNLSRPQAWPAPMSDERRVLLEDRVPQPRVQLVWNLPPNYTRELIELQLASEILGGGKNSRLFKRLVYTDQSATSAGSYMLPRELGSQMLLWVTGKADSDIGQLERDTLAELERFKAEGPSAAELERARTVLYTGFLRGLEQIGGFGGKSDVLASAEVIGGSADAWRKELDWLREATPKSVRDITRRWLGDGRLAITVLPEAPGQAATTGADRSQLPTVGPAPALDLPELQRATLSNGLQVVLAEQHSAPVVQFGLLTKAGYSVDPEQRGGLAAMTMSMLDEGAGGRDALAISQTLEQLGAHLGTDASLDSCSVTLSAISTMMAPALDIFADVIRRPDFPEHELNRLRPMALANIAQEKADPYRLALRTLPPLLYGQDHPYGVPFTGTGTQASVAAISRTDLVDYHKRWIRPDNAQLLVVGDTTLEKVLPLLEKRFGSWLPTGTAGKRELRAPQAAQGPRIFLIDRPDAEQTVVLAGTLVPPRQDPDDIAMTAANRLFGGLFTSRLNMNLRERRHWTYGARSVISSTAAERPLIAFARIEREFTAPAMAEIVREMRAMRDSQPPDEAELERARRNLTLNLPGNNETSGQLAGSFSKLLIYDLPDDYFDQFVGQVQALTPADVRRAAGKILKPEELTWVVVGDLARIEREIRALGLGEVSVVTPGE